MAESNSNSKIMNAIFMVVFSKEFKRISKCKIVKNTWDILETTHEGTKIVKNSKLHMPISKFEEIKMKNDEIFNEFYVELNDLVNSSFNLGEKTLKSQVVMNAFRSLLEKFRHIVTFIEKSKYVNSVKTEEHSLHLTSLSTSSLRSMIFPPC